MYPAGYWITFTSSSGIMMKALSRRHSYRFKSGKYILCQPLYVRRANPSLPVLKCFIGVMAAIAQPLGALSKTGCRGWDKAVCRADIATGALGHVVSHTVGHDVRHDVGNVVGHEVGPTAG